MEKGFSGVVSTIISNLFIVIIGSLYLILRKKKLYLGNLKNYSSFQKTIKTVYNFSDQEIASEIGLDGYLYLSLLKFFSYLLLLYSFIGLLGLIPIYSTQSLPGSTSLSQFSIEVMSNDDKDLIIPAVCSFLFFCGVYFLSFLFYKLPNNYPTYFPSVNFT